MDLKAKSSQALKGWTQTVKRVDELVTKFRRPSPVILQNVECCQPQNVIGWHTLLPQPSIILFTFANLATL